MCDQLEINHLKQELLLEIKHYISSPQQDTKLTVWMNTPKSCRTKLRHSRVRLCSLEGSKGKKTHSLSN